MIAMTCLMMLQFADANIGEKSENMDHYACLKTDGTVEFHGMTPDAAAKQFWQYVKDNVKNDPSWCKEEQQK